MFLGFDLHANHNQNVGLFAIRVNAWTSHPPEATGRRAPSHSRRPDVVPTVFVPVPHQRCIGPYAEFFLSPAVPDAYRPCPAGVPLPVPLARHPDTRVMLSDCATGASQPFQKRHGSVSEAFQAKAAKIAHTDQCTLAEKGVSIADTPALACRVLVPRDRLPFFCEENLARVLRTLSSVAIANRLARNAALAWLPFYRR